MRIFLRGLPRFSSSARIKQDAGQLAVRAGGGLQRDGVHAGDLGQRGFQARHHFHGALRQRFRLVGMRPGQAFDARHQLVDARVVLHGAGAQRIHAVIDGVVPGGEAREVADGFHFADFGEAVDLGAHVFGAQGCGRVHRRARRGREVGRPFLPGELRSKSSGSFCERWGRTLVIMAHASPESRGRHECLRYGVHIRALRHFGGAEQHAVGQLGIEAAKRQAADDFLLQQRLVDCVGRWRSRTTNSLKNGPVKRGFSLPAR